jgi:hypothetical protein
MKFLFHTIVAWPGKTGYYNVYQTDDGKYKAELHGWNDSTNKPPAEVIIWKEKSIWKTEDELNQYLAESVGGDVDRYVLSN